MTEAKAGRPDSQGQLDSTQNDKGLNIIPSTHGQSEALALKTPTITTVEIGDGQSSDQDNFINTPENSTISDSEKIKLLEQQHTEDSETITDLTQQLAKAKARADKAEQQHTEDSETITDLTQQLAEVAAKAEQAKQEAIEAAAKAEQATAKAEQAKQEAIEAKAKADAAEQVAKQVRQEAIEAKARADKAEKDMLIDPLTKCGSRYAWEILQKQFNSTPGNKTTIIILDINSLKWVNDNLGHLDGDKYIIDTVKHLLDTSSEGDRVFRIGGDEFAIVCDFVEPDERDDFNSSLDLKFNHEILDSKHLDFSFGVAFTGPEDSSIKDTIERADFVMYQNKFEWKAKNPEKHPQRQNII